MRAVLYTRELEPITVISVPMWLWERLEKGDPIRLMCPERSARWLNHDDLEKQLSAPVRTVKIWAEPFCYRDVKTIMLFTDDDELALALKADFLPGQQMTRQEEARKAFADGFLAAITGGFDG